MNWPPILLNILKSNNVMSPRSIDVVFKMIGFAIQKGLVAQLVARLSFIPLWLYILTVYKIIHSKKTILSVSN